MTTLPSGWVEKPLTEVVRLGSGGTPQAKNSAYYGGDIPWAIIGDLCDGVVSATARTITQLGLDSSSAKIVPADSILLGMYGSIGKLGIAGIPMATNQAIATMQVGDQLDVRYLFYYLLLERPKLDREGKGATQRNISQTILKPWPVRFPVDVSEQRRIVDILEDHLSRLDAADAGITQAEVKLRGFRERLIINAITGADIAQRGTAALPDIGTADGVLPTLPVGWSWSRLGEIAEVVGGVTKDSKKQSGPAFVEVPYLRVANVQRGHLRLDEVAMLRVDPRKAESLLLQPGDVLLNEGGDRDKLARGWVWEGQVAGCIHQNHVFRARIHEPSLDPYFLSWTANTIGGRWAERNGKQSVNLASISLSMIKKMPVILPAPGEAERRAQQIADSLDIVERLIVDIVRARTRGEGLRRSLLTAAFSGRLTHNSLDVADVGEMISA